MAEADLGNQLLEALALNAASAGLAEILIDHLYPLVRPSQADSAIDKTVLQLRALLMLSHLVNGRLPHVDVRQLGAMRRRKAFVNDVRDHQHGWSPFRMRRRRLAFAVSTRQLPGLPASASWPATSPMGAEDFLPAGGAGMPGAGVAETPSVLEGGVGPSRITSSARRARLAVKIRVKWVKVRKLTPGH